MYLDRKKAQAKRDNQTSAEKAAIKEKNAIAYKINKKRDAESTLDERDENLSLPGKKSKGERRLAAAIHLEETQTELFTPKRTPITPRKKSKAQEKSSEKKARLIKEKIIKALKRSNETEHEKNERREKD